MAGAARRLESSATRKLMDMRDDLGVVRSDLRELLKVMAAPDMRGTLGDIRDGLRELLVGLRELLTVTPT